MKIAAASLQLASTHVSEQRHELRESLHAWVGSRRPAAASEAPAPAINTVTLSDAGQAASAGQASRTEDASTTDEDPRLTLIRIMLERLFGQRITVFDAKDLQPASPASVAPPDANPAPSSTPAETPRPAGFGVEYERHEFYSESEQTRFAASGTVVTADGRKIDFSLQLEMSRHVEVSSDISLRLGDAARPVDPLVLNFAGSADLLTDQRFAFDLNADGQAEQINRLAAGNGFLVFDRNGDRRANDGSELFGPTSGSGFAELAALDEDGNGWIDENDSAFARLGVWTPDQSGNNAIRSLADAGVGALALTAVATPFSVKNNEDQLLGQVRSTGIFLQEDGSAGTMRQIDLTA